MNQIKSTIKTDWLWWLCIAAGVFLRLWQYFINRSFSADESSLAFNLVTRTFSGLTQPLDYQQGAPVGFLFIEKIFVLAFGNNEYVLRLLPLISGILAICLLYVIAKTYFGTSGLFAVFAFSIGWNLVYYSSELKQYSSDVFVTLLLIHLASRCINEKIRARDFILLGVSGALTIWISHPSVFVLAGIGLLLLIEKKTRKEYVPFTWILALGFAWLAAFALEYYVSLQYLVADKYLQNYWSKAFMPIPPWSNLRWFFDTYLSMLSISLSAETVAIFLVPVLGILGLVSLFTRKRKIALLLTLPVMVVVIACALQKYPLRGRFMLFLIPFFLLIVAEGIGSMYTFTAKRNHTLALALCCLPAIWLAWPPVMITTGEVQISQQGMGMRPVIAYVAEHRNPGDTIYVYHGADPAFHYYAPIFGINLKDKTIIIGESLVLKKRALQSFIDDVKFLKGHNRVWFIFSDIVDCGGCTGDMQVFYVDLLNRVGVSLDQFNAISANVYLYDLSR